MTAIRNKLSTIPAGRHALEIFDQNQTTASFTPGIGGFFNPATNNMNLDPTWGDFNNTAFVHEMNHDQRAHDGTTANTAENLKNMSRADYVNSMLAEESHGDALANQANNELAAAGTPQTSAPPNKPAYDAGYKEGVDAAKAANPNATPEELDAAGQKAGEQKILDEYKAGRVTPSTSTVPYNQFYGNAWDAAHPSPPTP